MFRQVLVITLLVAVSTSEGRAYGRAYFNPMVRAALNEFPRNAVKVCNKPVDLGFVMDDAGQTADGDDFGVVKQFVMKLDSKFPISDKGTHVGAISFGSQGHLRLLFGDLKGSENTLQHINNLISRWEGKPGDKRIISEGLKLAKDYLYAERNGMRPHAEKILVLLTNGKQYEKSRYGSPAELAEALRSDSGVRIIIVGISGSDPVELLRIAGWPNITPNFEDIYSMQNEGKIDEIADSIANSVCK